MELYESGQMYLEAIYVLLQKKEKVRSIDVGAYLGYSKPSVSRAVGILKKAGYVITDENGFLVLTESGLEVARKTYERHKILTKYFVKIGIDEQTASEDACKIEHVISDKTFEAIKKQI